MGRGIHLAEIQWPSTASSLMGSGDHAFLAHISSPGFLLGAGPPSVYASSLSSVRPVCPTFNPFAPPHPGIFFCFFFFFFFELWVLTAASWCPRVISQTSHSLWKPLSALDGSYDEDPSRDLCGCPMYVGNVKNWPSEWIWPLKWHSDVPIRSLVL